MRAPLLGLAKSIYYTFLKKFGSGMLLFESRFKQREREVTLVTTVGLLTQSNSSFNTPDIKTIFLIQCRDCTV